MRILGNFPSMAFLVIGLAACTVLLAAPCVAAGDVPVDLRGSTVRVTPNSGKRIVGTLSEIGVASLTVGTDTGPQVIPRDAIRKIEWRDQDGHDVVRSAVGFGIVTGVIGLLLNPKVFGTESPNSNKPFCTTRLECAAEMAGGGAVLGMIGGFAIPRPVWRKVPLTKVSATIHPMPGRVTAALTIAW